MEVIPAIDIRGGRCVRLYQGDYGQETVYAEDPSEVASQWISLGAMRLHIVDLDGAKVGEPVNLPIIKAIVSSTTVPVQIGGGIRTFEAAQTAIYTGVDRVIIGTAAVADPGLLNLLVDELGAERIVVSVDAKDGMVALRGWTESSEVSASDLIQQMSSIGVTRFLYTDITRDGTLTEPNFESIQSLISDSGTNLLAAGGISSVEHLTRLAKLGAEGAVVGKALYTGDIDLKEALETLSEQRQI